MSEQPPCCAKRYEITQAELPLSCPLPEYRLWDAHPRVYLPIKATGQAVCPYCGAEYILIDYQPEQDDEQLPG